MSFSSVFIVTILFLQLYSIEFKLFPISFVFMSPVIFFAYLYISHGRFRVPRHSAPLFFLLLIILLLFTFSAFIGNGADTSYVRYFVIISISTLASILSLISIYKRQFSVNASHQIFFKILSIFSTAILIQSAMIIVQAFYPAIFDSFLQVLLDPGDISRMKGIGRLSGFSNGSGGATISLIQAFGVSSLLTLFYYSLKRKYIILALPCAVSSIMTARTGTILCLILLLIFITDMVSKNRKRIVGTISQFFTNQIIKKNILVGLIAIILTLFSALNLLYKALSDSLLVGLFRSIDFIQLFGLQLYADNQLEDIFSKSLIVIFYDFASFPTDFKTLFFGSGIIDQTLSFAPYIGDPGFYRLIWYMGVPLTLIVYAIMFYILFAYPLTKLLSTNYINVCWPLLFYTLFIFVSEFKEPFIMKCFFLVLLLPFAYEFKTRRLS